MTRTNAISKLLLLALIALPASALGEGAAGVTQGCAAPVEGQHSARVVDLPAGADLQRALDEAQPGDTLVLAAGATFTGPFTLPKKRGVGWIELRSAARARLPPVGARVGPVHASSMPKLEAAAGSVIRAAPGAHHYRLVGLEIRPSRGAFLTDVVQLGGDDVRRSKDVPCYFTIDRCYVHGDPIEGARRGIALNSSYTDVIGSYFADFKEVAADSQAIAGWNGPGPFRIVDNYLEGAGENLMFGGADPAIPRLVPSDIEIRGNHFKKPLAWKTAEPRWSVKNLLELKNARRVRIEGNVFENNWVGAQNGFAILMTVRNQEGGAPWSVVEDVTFVRNLVRHSASAINILGRDDKWPSQRAARIHIANNLFDDIGGAAWGGGGTLLQLVGGATDVVVEHNTAFHSGNVITAEGEAHARFVFAHNIVQQNEYGIIGTATGPGRDTLAKYFPGAVVSGNVIVGGEEASYPPKNFFPASLEGVGLQPGSRAWPRLAASSAYHRAAADRTDIGVDLDALAPLAKVVAQAAPPGRAEAK